MAGRRLRRPIAELRKERESIGPQTKAFLGEGLGLLAHTTSWTDLILDCHYFAVGHVNPSNPHRDFLGEYAALSAVAVSVAEAAQILLDHGFYASSMSLSRLISSMNDLLDDIANDDESLTLWQELKKIDPKDHSKEANKKRLYFIDAKVRQRVKQRGSTPFSEGSYSVLSEVLHGTPWGSHVYLPESFKSPGIFNIEYRPQYHPIRSLWAWTLLTAPMVNIVAEFLEKLHLDYDRNKRFQNIAQQYRGLNAEFEDLTGKTTNIMQEYEELVTTATETGEPFEELLSDAIRQFRDATGGRPR